MVLDAYRGELPGPLYEFGVPKPIRHAVVAGWRLDAGDVAGAVVLADELLAIAEVTTQEFPAYTARTLYFPYLMTHGEEGGRFEPMTPPWYSGMAQARIAGVFARLYRETGADRWKRAAVDTYRSLIRIDRTRRLWHWEGTTRWVDTFSWSPPNPVLNGHLFAIVGLHDYWLVLGGDATVLKQIISTVGTDGHRFMAAGGRHHYDLARSGLAGRYYSEIVYEQMQEIGVMAPCLAAAADKFINLPPK
jgi:hypothetical protein